VRWLEEQGHRPAGYVADVTGHPDSPGWREAERIVQVSREPTSAPEPRPLRGKGVGDHLHDLIVARFGVAAKGGSGGGCGCRSMIRTLNAWGHRKCAQRIQEIVGHLLGQREHLPRRYRWALRIPGGQAVAAHEARAMVEQAISRAGAASGYGAGNGRDDGSAPT
jgi:hypothetical protein